MKRIIAPNFGKRSTPGLRRLSRTVAGILGILLLTVAPAQADSIQVNRVVSNLKNLQGTTDLQLTLAQDPVTTATKTASVGPNGSVARIGSNDPKLDALLSGFPIVPNAAEIGLDDVSDEGEVDGTICDCGEILIAGAGFPKWPLILLAAVPLVFIPDCDGCEQSEPTPTPPSNQSTPTPTPEPASLLIFGTGLAAFGAGLRRRYKAKLGIQTQKTGEE